MKVYIVFKAGSECAKVISVFSEEKKAANFVAKGRTLKTISRVFPPWYHYEEHEVDFYVSDPA